MNLPGSWFRVYDTSGFVIASDTAVQTILFSGEKNVLRQRGIMENISLHGRHYRSFSKMIVINEHQPWVLQVGTPLTEIEHALERLQFFLWGMIPLALLICAGAVSLIVRRSFAPLSTMIQTVERISASHLNERMDIPSRQNEVVMLGAAWNRMMERIEAAFKSQQQFMADASHELRTPLAIIQSELEYADRFPLGTEVKISLTEALQELTHLGNITSDLLLLARMENEQMPLHLQTIRLDKILADCVKRISRLAKEKKVFLFMKIGNATECSGDEEKLRRVFLNLIDNAIKYTPAGGEVVVSIRKEETGIQVSIRDSGIGINPADLPDIFKPFYRSDVSRASHTGNGLGLSIVQRIIMAHHGTVRIENNQEKGAIAIVEFPI
jgi:signal transduction histidine kinase